MTIAKRIFANTAVLSLGLLVAGVGIVATFLALQRLVTSTHEEFHELCDLRRVSAHLALAGRFLADGDQASAQTQLRDALSQLNQYDQFQTEEPSEFGPQHAQDEEIAARRIFIAISNAQSALASSGVGALVDSAVHDALAQAAEGLDALTDQIEQAVLEVHSQVARRFSLTLWLLVAIEFASLVATMALSFILYRNVVIPLRQLRDGTDRLAEGRLNTRLEAVGDREIVELQNGFNRMASELETLCSDLERRVAEKGRELAVAERLASVGYLAAGVAHEINNPLAIMSGYTESLLRTARNGRLTQEPDTWVRDLETIRDEAFRCKRITQSLLDLSRLGDDHREPVALDHVVSNCISLIGAWPASHGVAFEIQPSSCDGSVVLASEPELKQVILNLLANAVEATTPTHGTVTVGMERNNGWIELVVRDNGCGMTPDTLAHVFEPFFTSGKPRVGLGLGLSISHSIAQRHGGMLEASSSGPGCGATIVLRLPAFEERAN